MDLGSIDLAAGSFVVELTHPATGTPIVGEDGNVMSISVVGRYSDKYIKVQKAQQNRRLKAVGRKVKITADEMEAEANELIIACIVGWSANIKLDGEVLEFNAANARKIVTDHRLAWIKAQLDEAIADDANFTKNSTQN